MAKQGGNSKKYGPVGEEDIRMEDLKPSFLKLAQKTSNIAGAKPGDIVDNTSGENFGTEVKVIPVKKYIDWIKFNEDNQVEDRSFDGVKWAQSGREMSEDERWRDKRINFMVFVDGYPSELPYILSFGKTSYKAGTAMDNAISKNIKFNGEPIFARKFIVKSAKAMNKKKQEYFVFECQMAEETEPAVLEAADKSYKMFSDIIANNKQKLLAAENPEDAFNQPAPKTGARKPAGRKY